MTFEDMCTLEPLLALLRDDINRVSSRGKKHFCANKAWVRRFKPRLIRLVGWYAYKEELRTSEAYELAYRTLYSLLPNCRHCRCL